MNDLRASEVRFWLGKKPINFNIIHNMPDIAGMRLTDAVHSWIARTKNYTDYSLVEYIRDKQTGFDVMTEDQYTEIMKHAPKKSSSGKAQSKH